MSLSVRKLGPHFIHCNQGQPDCEQPVTGPRTCATPGVPALLQQSPPFPRHLVSSPGATSVSGLCAERPTQPHSSERRNSSPEEVTMTAIFYYNNNQSDSDTLCEAVIVTAEIFHLRKSL